MALPHLLFHLLTLILIFEKNLYMPVLTKSLSLLSTAIHQNKIKIMLSNSKKELVVNFAPFFQ